MTRQAPVEEPTRLDKIVEFISRRALSLVAVLGLVTVGLAVSTILVASSGTSADELQRALVASCETSPTADILIRGAYRENRRIRGDIQESLATPHSLFPDIPRYRFNQLIKKSVKRKRSDIAANLHDIKRLRHLDCRGRY